MISDTIISILLGMYLGRLIGIPSVMIVFIFLLLASLFILGYYLGKKNLRIIIENHELTLNNRAISLSTIKEYYLVNDLLFYSLFIKLESKEVININAMKIGKKRNTITAFNSALYHFLQKKSIPQTEWRIFFPNQAKWQRRYVKIMMPFVVILNVLFFYLVFSGNQVHWSSIFILNSAFLSMFLRITK